MSYASPSRLYDDNTRFVDFIRVDKTLSLSVRFVPLYFGRIRRNLTEIPLFFSAGILKHDDIFSREEKRQRIVA